ncbi:MAG: cupin domain-containing protein [Betaproteobacteria bacterium]
MPAPRSTPPARAAPEDARALLGGVSPGTFLRADWQRRARLVRAALPGFRGPFSREALFALAGRDDVESRLVVRNGSRWRVEHGPFTARSLGTLPARAWTLLVQGTNLVDARADALMRRFAFVPYARLDDVMVSYAAPGGGVGPHLDSYDVFLLQGFGRRRWRWGAQRDASFVPGLPLRILARFAPTHDAVLSPGDMLYLPPDVAHDGVAIDACTTYSIGFRAPAASEIGGAFLTHLAETVDLAGRYADAGPAVARQPARIPAAMRARVRRTLARIRFGPREVDTFLGQWLTEPKPLVLFAPRAHVPSRDAFARALRRRGARLDLATQALYDARALYINGERVTPGAQATTSLRRFADRRSMSPVEAAALDREALELIRDWYRHGWIHHDAA